MKQKENHTIFWIKAILWLLLVIFIFTIASRAADSFTIAKVSIENPSARKIQYNIQIQGRVVKNRELPVITQPDILIKSILVNEGQRVQKGAVLAKLDIASLNECINSIESEKKILRLQNKDLLANREQAEAQRNRNIARAEQDLTQVQIQNKEAVLLAEKELDRAQKALEKQKTKLYKLKQKLDTARKKNRQDISSILAKKKEQESLVSAFKDDVSVKKKALTAARQTKKSEEKAAEREVHDAYSELSSDSSIDINNISINNYNIQLKKLKKLKAQKGKVCAPAGGIITALMITVGQKTPDTAIFTMTDDSAGLKFIGQMDAEDARYVSAGDTVSLKLADKNINDIHITSIETDESREFLNVTALLPAKMSSIGESAVMEAVQMSGNYNCTVPATAVYQEDSKNYVLVAEVENTIMGSQDIARKVEVEVLEKNNLYAALDPDTLANDSQVIINTDRYVNPGDRIRIKSSGYSQSASLLAHNLMLSQLFSGSLYSH